jgi:cholesterol transport system auxiliary component
MSAWPRRLVSAALLLALTGCASLLPAPGAPPQLYRLTPASGFPAGLPKISAQLLVDRPTAPAALDTSRIALSRGPIQVDYFADAAWTDRAPILVQSIIVESLENSGRANAVARESPSLRADDVLRLEMRHFEAEYAGSGPPTVRVSFTAKLVGMPDRRILAQRTFDASSAATKNDMPAIILAFDAALHQATSGLVAWTLRTVAGGRR